MAVRLSGGQWDELTLRLLVRSGGLCEARTPACLAPGGRLDSGVRVSRHHRLPRGEGGSSLPDQHGVENLLLVCGDGVVGCHGWLESHRSVAYERGLLVHRGMDPAEVPVRLASGRLVLLDPSGGFYLEIGFDPR